MTSAAVHEHEPAVRPGESRRARVLVLSRNYPSVRWPGRGLWARRLVEAGADCAEPTVIAPVPWALPWAGHPRGAAMPERHVAGALGDVWHPRTPAGLTYYSHAFDADLELPILRRIATRLHGERPFDLIHAHFMYPDGVVASRLGRELGIPVITTEHTYWRVWKAQRGRVWRQVRAALEGVHTVTAVSEVLRREIEELTDGAVRTAVLPNLVEEELFRPTGMHWEEDHLLFVGLIRRVKGLDLLLRAVAALARSRPRIRLTVVSSAYLQAYRTEELEARRLASALGIADRVSWVGERTPAEVADAMRRAAVVVVPSRRETFCSVAVEALACGTPVVATRCGGPEEVMPSDSGCLVPVDDLDALVAGIDGVLRRRARFDPLTLRAGVVSRFGRAAIAGRIRALYGGVAPPPRS